MSSEPRENKKVCHFGGVYGHFEAIMGSWMCGVVSLDVDEIGAG